MCYNISEVMKLIKAEYISCTRDIWGDIVDIEVRDIKTGKHAHATPAQIVATIQQGLVEIKYIKVSSDGNLHITKKNKFTVGDKIKKLESEIQNLEKSPLPSDRDKAVKKRNLLQKLDAEKYKFKKFTASNYEEK